MMTHDQQKRGTSKKTTFTNHLERISQIVSTWPSWKQSVLGGRVQQLAESQLTEAKARIEELEKDVQEYMAALQKARGKEKDARDNLGVETVLRLEVLAQIKAAAEAIRQTGNFKGDATWKISPEMRRILDILTGNIPDPSEKERHPEDYCHTCGNSNISWHTSNPLWNKVISDKTRIICPVCFASEAERKGINPASWLLTDTDPQSCIDTAVKKAKWFADKDTGGDPSVGQPPGDVAWCMDKIIKILTGETEKEGGCLTPDNKLFEDYGRVPGTASKLDDGH